MFSLLCFPSQFSLLGVFWRILLFFFLSRLGLRIMVRGAPSFSRGALWFPCKEAPAPALMRVKGIGLLFVYSWPHRRHHYGRCFKDSTPVPRRCARSAVGCQHQDPPGASPPTRPTGHLRLFEPKFLLGAQPSLVRNLRGLGSPWRFPKSRLAETMKSEASRKGAPPTTQVPAGPHPGPFPPTQTGSQTG